MLLLYSLAIFLGAALLFTVQPLFTRLLLPLLGGAPSVWNTAQVFFQVALLAGYGYAHLGTTRLGIRRHARIHLAVLLLPLLALPLNLSRASSPPADTSPVPWLLATMLVTVGPPFFVLSATGPLLQRWFSATAHPRAKDPYFLYAASNLGSMLALLAYPTLIEPHLRLQTQTSAWAFLYGLLIALLAAASFFVKDKPAEEAASREPAPPLARAQILRWIGLAFVPSSLMIGTTTALTTDIASAPLLWIIPLSIYLLTFILAFAARPLFPRRPVLVAAPLLIALGVAAAAIPLGRPTWLVIGLSLLILFGLSLAFHGELAHDRPGPRHLTAFFFWISLGGALGGAFATLIAPLVFRSVIEVGVTLVLAAFLLPASGTGDQAPGRRDVAIGLGAAALCAGALFLRQAGALPGMTAGALGFALPALLALRASSRPIRLGLSFGALLAVGLHNQGASQGVILRGRTFFGAFRVTEARTALAGLVTLPADASGAPLRSLYHGATLHGVQSTSPLSSIERREPLSYYAREGPIGQVFAEAPLPRDARVAVVGLGVGSLLAYAQPEQRWTFYEIDPRMAQIAQDPRYFTFVADAAAPVSIVLGDARQSLARSTDRFSLLVLDAYSSDAVPLHLLTREAMEVYLARLSAGGIIAAHISNRHLDLGPVLAGLGEALGLVVLEQDLVVNALAMARGKMPSRWVVLARRREDLGALADDPRWSELKVERPVVWTDDYSSLWSVWRGR